ncbi:MAG: glycoside hydrolase family 10 protein [Armatimonadota bacterium]
MPRLPLYYTLAGLSAPALLFTTVAPSAFSADSAPTPPAEVKPAATPLPAVPAPEREMRGVWVATVDNIDWPSRRGLPAAEQQRELLAIFDRAVELKLNTIVLQVRPACDALYESKLEPWSEYLTGEMGRAPEPRYDPLAFAVKEAHRRGLELHAWFNPYRALHPSAKGPIAGGHVSKTKPALVRKYGRHLWLDPGDAAVQDHSLAVILDVVRRYDIDGVHMDDYFYPYKERDTDGKVIPFPDDPSWSRYRASGGKLSRDDWRRNNVDRFVKRLHGAIKKEKSWVRFGISPFGIWRPGHPPQIQGFDQYSELYADARKWLVEGWVDYFTPQLYWKIDQAAQSYPVLLKWWTEQNPKQRHLWPGNFTSRVGDGSGSQWEPAELANQVRLTRAQPGAGGNIHFSMKPLMQNRAAINDHLAGTVYREPALVPATPWLDSQAPATPNLEVDHSPTGERTVTWKPGDAEKPWLWVVQYRRGGKWTTEVRPAGATGCDSPATAGVDYLAVSAVDRCGNQSEPAVTAL